MAAATQAGSNNDLSCVHRAVVAGESADQVRRLIEGYAQGSDERRKAVVDYRSSEEGNAEAPLNAAHRLARGDLVAVLLESGADATAIGPKCHPLALAVHYRLLGTLRELLRSGRHHPNEQIPYKAGSSTADGRAPDGEDENDGRWCRLVHLIVAPPRRSQGDPQPPPLLEALHMLKHEFGLGA
jgi:hypothetical protein